MIYEANIAPPTNPQDIQYVEEVEEYNRTLKGNGAYFSDPDTFYSCNITDGGYGALYSFVQEIQRSWGPLMKIQHILPLRFSQYDQFRSQGEIVVIQHGIVIANDSEIKIFNGTSYKGYADVVKITVKSMSAITAEEIARSGLSDEWLEALFGKTMEKYGENYPYTLTTLKGPTALEMLAGEVISFVSSEYQPPVS